MYETYVIEQLIPLIDSHFRTIANRSARAVMGESMGGYGAMMFAAHHPDMFAAAASLSGAVDSNPPADGAALSASSTADGAPPDAIYGPRVTQEARWHGHNPVDLAANLRDVNLQLRSADGNLDPAIGETPADAEWCLIESGIHTANIDLHQQLLSLHIPHLWKDYGAGCHTVPNFEREIADSLPVLAHAFARRQAAPASFNYRSIEPHIDIWGWHIDTDPARALEFLNINNASRSGLTLVGSGTTAVTTTPLFHGLRHVDVMGGVPQVATPDAEGHIRFEIDLGPADRQQQYGEGATTAMTTRTVTFAPHAIVRITRIRVTHRGVRICARTIGGNVNARISLVDGHARPAARSFKTTLTATATCGTLPWTHVLVSGSHTLTITGRDLFGHAVTTRQTITLAARPR
jgi:esterase/lipase superfamily enzyme